MKFINVTNLIMFVMFFEKIYQSDIEMFSVLAVLNKKFSWIVIFSVNNNTI